MRQTILTSSAAGAFCRGFEADIDRTGGVKMWVPNVEQQTVPKWRGLSQRVDYKVQKVPISVENAQNVFQTAHTILLSEKGRAYIDRPIADGYTLTTNVHAPLLEFARPYMPTKNKIHFFTIGQHFIKIGFSNNDQSASLGYLKNETSIPTEKVQSQTPSINDDEEISGERVLSADSLDFTLSPVLHFSIFGPAILSLQTFLGITARLDMYSLSELLHTRFIDLIAKPRNTTNVTGTTSLIVRRKGRLCELNSRGIMSENDTIVGSIERVEINIPVQTAGIDRLSPFAGELWQWLKETSFEIIEDNNPAYLSYLKSTCEFHGDTPVTYLW